MAPSEAGLLKTLWRTEKPLLALTATAAVAYATLSLVKHWHFGSNAYDFGNFDQIVWNYSRLRAPASTQLGVENALGDHFSPVLALCAPLFWVLPRAEMLLLAQVVLVAASFIPIFLYCERRAGRYAAYALTASYAVFWGVQRTLWTDFHPDAFAMPLIATAVLAIHAKRWGWAYASIGLLLGVKEELAVLVAFFGVYLLTEGRRKVGAAFFAGGTGFFLTAVLVLIPFFCGPNGRPAEWIYTDLGPDAVASLAAAVKNPLLPLKLMFSHEAKLRAYALLLGPFLLLPLFSRQFLLLLPLLATKELTNNPNIWDLSTHYAAFLCPLVVTAAADGLSNLADFASSRPSLSKLLPYAPAVILFINVALIAHNSPWRAAENADYWFYGDKERTGGEALRLIAPDASVVTQTSIAPHLTHRRSIYALDFDYPCAAVQAEYFIVNRDLNAFPLAAADIDACVDDKRKAGYKTLLEKDGWVVMKNEVITSGR